MAIMDVKLVQIMTAEQIQRDRIDSYPTVVY